MWGHTSIKRSFLQSTRGGVLVFVSSKVLADELAEVLGREGFSTEAMHGGRKQWDRDEVFALLSQLITPRHDHKMHMTLHSLISLQIQIQMGP